MDIALLGVGVAVDALVLLLLLLLHEVVEVVEFGSGEVAVVVGEAVAEAPTPTSPTVSVY